MKIKNQKKTQRILNFYFRNFGVGRPYTVLIDGTFCSSALEARIPIKDQIPIFLGDEKTKIVTTPCIIMEVEKLGKIRSVLHASWLIVKQFAIVKCGHEGKPVPAAQCIMSLLKEDNPKKYIVALQDRELKHQILNSVPGTPLISLNKQAPVLEKPTNKCQTIVKESYRISSAATYRRGSLMYQVVAGKTVFMMPDHGIRKQHCTGGVAPTNVMAARILQSSTTAGNQTLRGLSVSHHEESTLQAMKRKYLGEENSDQPEPKKKKFKKKHRFPCKKGFKSQGEEKDTAKIGRGRHNRKKKHSNLIKNFLQASTS